MSSTVELDIASSYVSEIRSAMQSGKPKAVRRATSALIDALRAGVSEELAMEMLVPYISGIVKQKRLANPYIENLIDGEENILNLKENEIDILLSIGGYVGEDEHMEGDIILKELFGVDMTNAQIKRYVKTFDFDEDVVFYHKADASSGFLSSMNLQTSVRFLDSCRSGMSIMSSSIYNHWDSGFFSRLSKGISASSTNIIININSQNSMIDFAFGTTSEPVSDFLQCTKGSVTINVNNSRLGMSKSQASRLAEIYSTMSKRIVSVNANSSGFVIHAP